MRQPQQSGHVSEIGVSALKGGRHQPRQQIHLTDSGPEGDREFAVIDLDRGQVLRTVVHPSLLRCEAHVADDVLTLTVDGQRVAAIPHPAPGIVQVDYWGRDAAMQVVAGPWTPLLTRLFPGNIALARTSAPGAVVYGAAVTLTTTSALRRLEDAAGGPVDPRRFRSTFTVDTGAADADVDDSWTGREFSLGAARVRVTGGVPRCAVIDSDPDTGERGTQLLKTLAGYRLAGAEIMFGVYAEVVTPGLVTVGDSLQPSATLMTPSPPLNPRETT